MASKFVILATAMAAFMVMAHAMTIEDRVGMTGDQCRSQLRSMWPSNCEQYLMESMMKYRANPAGRQYFDMCCQDLKMMKPECQCEAMEMMVQQMPMRQQEEGMMYKMMEKAMMLPMMCDPMMHKCHMSMPYMH